MSTEYVNKPRPINNRHALPLPTKAESRAASQELGAGLAALINAALRSEPYSFIDREHGLSLMMPSSPDTRFQTAMAMMRELAMANNIPSPRPRIAVDLTRDVVTFDGAEFPVTPDQAVAMKGLVDAYPGWVPSKNLKSAPSSRGRPDKILKRLPPDLRLLIKTQTGAGIRLVLPAA
jgi:hypothetical protein